MGIINKPLGSPKVRLFESTNLGTLQERVNEFIQSGEVNEPVKVSLTVGNTPDKRPVYFISVLYKTRY